MKRAKIATERDIEIMRLAGNNGIIGFKQIKREFFELASDKTARERLSQLEKAGWIANFRSDARERGELVFKLTDEGRKLFSKVERDLFMTARPTEYKQQLNAIDARYQLKQQLDERGAKLIDWKNEHQLKSEYGHLKHVEGVPQWQLDRLEIADARATVEEADGQQVEIDIEIDGAYYGKQLDEKIGKMANGSRPALWVTTPNRAERIANEIAPHANLGLMVIGD